MRWLSAIGGVSAVIWLFQKQFAALYPPHDFWVTNPANAAQRVTLVMAVLLGLLALEYRVPASARWAPVRFVNVYGTSSMAAYFWHLMLLFFRLPLGYLIAFGFSFNSWWGEKCGWGRYALLVVVLWVGTWALTWLTDQVYRRVDRRLPSLPGARAAAAPPPVPAPPPA